ncbi:MAG: helix-turn-helix transcriptional regulator [Xanthomonadales bacterium]|nr:helix-turn-helix transcriptional regulator [Xanthomonadales bacterium]
MINTERADLQVLSTALLRLHDADGRQGLSARLVSALHLLVAPDEVHLSWASDSRLQRLLGEAGLAADTRHAQQLTWSQRRRARRSAGAVAASDQDARHLCSRLELPGGSWLQIDVFRDKEGFDLRSELQLELLSEHVRAILQRTLNAPAQRRRGDANNLRRAFLSLSQREKDVLEGLVLQKQNREIADRLQISPGTVKRHLENLYAKLGVSGRAEARLLYGSLLADGRN